MATPLADFTPRQRRRLQDTILSLADEKLDTDRYFAVAAELVEESGQWIVQLFVESTEQPKTGKRISLDECADLCRQLVDSIETLPELKAYDPVLEVGSPGLFRAIQSPRELQFYEGQVVQWGPPSSLDNEGKVITEEPLYKGRLSIKALDTLTVTLTPDDPEADSVTLSLEGEAATVLTLAPKVDWPDN